MPAKPPPWIDPRPPSVAPLIRSLLGLAVLFLIGFALTRANANAGIFVFLAVVCLGLVLVALFARGVQRFGGRLLKQASGSEHDLFGGALLLIALLTPWTIAVPTLHWQQRFGWQSPLALLAIAAMVFVYIRPFRRYAVPGIAFAALALLGWFTWLSVLTVTAPFARSGFPFLPIDLMGDGWYIALLAFAVTVDGMAVRASDDERPARPSEVWPFALIPGMGLLRLHYPGRARLWLLAAAVCVFFLQATAVSAQEFQYYASLGSLPVALPRAVLLIPLAFLMVVLIASLLDTRARLRLEWVREDPLHPVRYRRPTIV